MAHTLRGVDGREVRSRRNGEADAASTHDASAVTATVLAADQAAPGGGPDWVSRNPTLHHAQNTWLMGGPLLR